MNDNSGIAYGVSLIVITIFILGVAWISMSPVIDEFKTLVDNLHAQNPNTYTTVLVSKINILYNIWGYFLTITMAVAFIYIVVQSIRKRAIDG